jgi:hypothetical protein
MQVPSFLLVVWPKFWFGFHPSAQKLAWSQTKQPILSKSWDIILTLVMDVQNLVRLSWVCNQKIHA